MTEQLSPEQKRLVETHIKLAQTLGLQAWRRNPEEMEKYEVVAVAYQGLLSAALRFDPDWRPPADPKYDPFLAFGSYARTRINGTIKDWQRQQDHVPKRQRKIYKELQQKGHGEGRTLEELAEITGLDLEKLRAITRGVEEVAVSLDAVREDADASLYDLIPSSDTEVSAVVSSVQLAVVSTIREMPENQQLVVYMKYYSRMDFAQISMELRLSPTLVRMYHREAVDRIFDRLRQSVIAS